MNRLSIKRRAQILAMLTEGNSMRATARMAGCSFNTVSKLLLDLGAVCTEFQDRTLHHLYDVGTKAPRRLGALAFLGPPCPYSGQLAVGLADVGDLGQDWLLLAF